MAIFNSETSVTTFEGCVINMGERNKMDDSDFYATVWNRDKQIVEKITYGTTRCYTYHISCDVDMTLEMLNNELLLASENPNEFKVLRDSFESDYKSIDMKVYEQLINRRLCKGDRVTVKSKKDENVYTVFWLGADRYQSGKTRVGIVNVDDKDDKKFVTYRSILKEVDGKFLPTEFKHKYAIDRGVVNYEDINKSRSPKYTDKVFTSDPLDSITSSILNRLNS